MWYLNTIRHHDGCRLVHPAKWDIGQFRVALVTNANWCIPPGCSFGISIQFKMSRIDRFIYNSIYHSYAFCCQTFPISHFPIHMHFRIIVSKIYLFYILISCTHFIFIWYTTKTLEIRIEVSEQAEAVDSPFLPFDFGPRLGDPHPSLVNNNYATLSG